MIGGEPNQFQQRGSRFISALLGAGIGLAVGIFWTFVFGPVTDGPPSIGLSLLVYSTGFTTTGLAVGAIQRLPILVGIVTGTVVLSWWALAIGPQDSWMVLWLIVFGGSGLFWGGIIGCIFWIIQYWRLEHGSRRWHKAWAARDTTFSESWPHHPNDSD